MALEAVVFQQDLFGYDNKDLYDLLGGNWSCDFDDLVEKEEKVSFDILENQTQSCHYEKWTSPPPSMAPQHLEEQQQQPDMANPKIPEEYDPQQKTILSTRPKRRSSKRKKNKEEMENQRMTHIAIERNRRKQMNQYLSVLRALMPDSCVPKGDQASIVGGAINYVKELEQRLQSIGGQKHINQKLETGLSLPFAEFFTLPQYSTSENSTAMEDLTAEYQSAVADIEVSMVESHANLKIRSKRRPKQLLKLVSGLQSLKLTILHLNVTTVDQIVLYSLSIKVEDDCKLTSVDEIATAVNEMLATIQEEALLI